MVSRRTLWLTSLAVHVLLTFCICCWETAWLVGHSSTILPQFVTQFYLRADATATTIVTKAAQHFDPARQALNAYLHLAGIQSGYGFFAPNVPDGYKILFALSYPDGHEDLLSAEADRVETNVRLARLTDYIGRTESDIVRENMIKLLAFAAWQGHRDATEIRASLLTLRQPTAEEYLRGLRPTYNKTYEYEFSPRQPIRRPANPPN